MDKLSMLLGKPTHTHVMRNVKVEMYNGLTHKQIENVLDKPNHISRPDLKGNKQSTWYLDDGRILVHHIIYTDPSRRDKFTEYTLVKTLNINENDQCLSLTSFLLND